MEFRKMITMTLYNMRDSKRDTDVKNRLLDSGRRRGWDDERIALKHVYYICEIDDQSRFDA